LNPNFFWKGEETARAEVLEIVIKYKLFTPTETAEQNENN